MRASHAFVAAVIVTAVAPMQAQERRTGPANNAYVVEYNFRESGTGAAAMDRLYGLRVNGEHKGSFKVGKRTPIASASYDPNLPNSVVTTQYTYLDVGISIECTLLELDTRVELHTAVVLGGVADAAPPAGAGRNAGINNPTINETKLDVTASVQIGKPTILASISDPVTNRTLQVTATITAAN